MVSNLSVEQLRQFFRDLQLNDKGNRETLERRFRAYRKEHQHIQSSQTAPAEESDKTSENMASSSTIGSGSSNSTSTTKWTKQTKKSKKSFDYFCIIDFEATCEEGRGFDFDNEIIEFPAVLLDGETLDKVDEFHMYVRPVLNPILSEFCTKLTGITQSTVDSSQPFPVVLAAFESWLHSHELPTTKTCAFVTDGPWDLRDFLHKQCGISKIARPECFARWINIRHLFRNHFSKTANLDGMLTHLGLTFEGQPHSGIDDSRNIARITQSLFRLGVKLKINDKIRADLEPYQPGTAAVNAAVRKAMVDSNTHDDENEDES